jgi:glycosyltransferase involved in cell wall biosynthesis
MIWFISKYALPPKYGAQARLFHISDELNLIKIESVVITSATNHLAALPIQTEIYKLETFGNSKTIFLKGLKFANSLTKNRVLSWFYFEWILFRFINNGYKNLVESPTVIYVSSLSLMTILNGYYAKKKFGAKLIFEVRDIWPLSAILVAGYSKWHPFVLFLRWVEKFGYRNADIVVSPLTNLKQHIEESIGKRKFEFCHIPQGFDMKLLLESQNLSQSFIQKYIPQNKFIFGYIGNVVSAYDLDSLIKCAHVLDKDYPNIHFLVLGDGEYKEVLINKSIGVSNITFIPRIPKNQIPHFLSFCNVATNFLKPEPLFKYGVSPQKLVDYMFASKPILMSYTGFKTIVEELNIGMVVESGNITKLVEAMIKFSKFTDDELLVMGQKGNQYLLNNLSWEIIVNTNLKIFCK